MCSPVKDGDGGSYRNFLEHKRPIRTPRVNPLKTGIGEIIAIFWNINDQLGVQGLKNKDRGSYSHFLEHKRPTRSPRVKRRG